MKLNPGEVSLKTKILVLVGVLTVGLLLFASIVFSYQGKKMVIEHLKRSSEGVTSAFSVFVLDAMLKDANGLESVADVLGHYTLDFIEKNPKILSIAVKDSQDHILAGDGMQQIKDLGLTLNKTSGPPSLQSYIQQSKTGQWIATVVNPIYTGSRYWGMVVIHFNANPEQREVVRLFWGMVIITSILTVSVLFILGFFLSRLTRSLSVLRSEMDGFDPDSETLLTPISTQDEIGVLFQHFNHLKRRLAQSRIDFLKAQKQVFHAEKLASIGRFASGMAHEINNPLNGIQNCLYAIRREPGNVEQTMEYLDLVTEGLNHIELVVRKLLGFSRKQAHEKGPLDFKKELDSILGLLEFKLEKEAITIESRIDENLSSFMGDPHLIQELMMNLVLNSFDAITERKAKVGPKYRGRLAIEITKQEDGVNMRVEDNGTGIPEDVLNQIFDPFFTTKEQGKGTGLGLSVALGIAQAHGGSIEVQSQVGSGTQFVVYLPMEEIDANSSS